ncbi:MAG: acyltransferase [Fibrobacteres bacterium]|nr:acyltransferase [Fibrobacterota bacterium]
MSDKTDDRPAVVAQCDQNSKTALTASLHKNHFDVLRVLAAFLVIWSHSHDLLGIPDTPLIFGMTFSMVGLTIFFAISGFLVSGSALSQTHFKMFFLRRFFRIWPGLAVNIFLLALVVGPIYSTFPITQYFSSPKTWLFLAGILIYALRWQLPGVWQNLPTTGVNGSLWTIPHEFSFYLFSWALKKLGILSNWKILAAICLFSSLAIDLFKEPIIEANIRFVLMSTRWLLHFGTIFVIGSLFKILWTNKRSLLIVTFLSVALQILFSRSGHWHFYTFFAFVGVILFMAHLPYGHAYGKVTRGIDFSYGLYLWGFPIQQAVIHYFGASQISPNRLTLTTFVVAMVFAWFSWTLIERPALSHVRGPSRG